MTRRLVDPVNVFDSDGHSRLENERNRARVQELEAENERLKRLLLAQVKKNQTITEDHTAPTLH